MSCKRSSALLLWSALACGLPPRVIAAPPWDACFAAAGRYYGLAPSVLAAIAEQESSFDPAAVNRNSNGSRDVGLMQINDRWLPALRAAGITEGQLLDACTSIWVGAWILAQGVAQRGYSWEAVGAYNAGTREGARARRAAYAQRIRRRLDPPVDAAPARQRMPAAPSRRPSGITEYSLAADAADDPAGEGGGIR